MSETKQVPVTGKMLEAGQAECPADATLSHASLRAVFEAMIAAAPATEPSEVERLAVEVAAAINRNSAENVSNTPDFIIANFLTNCLDALNKAINRREEWYGKSHHPDHPELVRVGESE